MERRSQRGTGPRERAAEQEARKGCGKRLQRSTVTVMQLLQLKPLECGKRGARPIRALVITSSARRSRLRFAQAGNKLMVPLWDVTGQLHGLQYISPEGEKIFGTGTAKGQVPPGRRGHRWRAHQLPKATPRRPVMYMATGWPVVTCFDAGNLAAVVCGLAQALPLITSSSSWPMTGTCCSAYPSAWPAGHQRIAGRAQGI